MKRFTALILAFILIMAALSGCSSQSDKNSDGKISIVCTIFPQYDWVRQILGSRADNFELTLLLNNRIDLHNYQPSVSDIAKISTSDLFIYVGGESDTWVENAIKQAVNPDMVAINLMESLGAGLRFEEIVEGMQDEEHDEDGDEHEEVYDEHVWLSLRNAQVLASAIADAILLLDSDSSEYYQNNLDAYIDKLKSLDAEYKKAVDEASVKTLLFGDRFPFRYFVDDYGLNYYAAFPGCSAETEASFNTIVFLATKIDELNLKNIIVTESSDQSIARTIINNTANKNQQIFVLDAIQSISESDVANGATYLSIMESNLNVLKDALK